MERILWNNFYTLNGNERVDIARYFEVEFFEGSV